ncbi:class I SAM-dependent methyltransferase [Streptomyces sp. 8N616]|uniref:class I SAM-dependent methyltransferase n=1 Tax=Streptomyces sp. 8N616 TaxID=3457414 RepID=UPI003FD270DA
MDDETEAERTRADETGTPGTGTAAYGDPAATYWDSAAARFDDEPDHGLRDPAVRAAWGGRLAGWLPGEPSDVLDLGCGTGSLALLAAEQGHRVTAVDLSPRMAERARAKLAGTGARVLVGDAAEPPVGERRFDAVLARHVLWMLGDPAAVLRRWSGLLRPGGRLVLIEGFWGTGTGTGTRTGTARPVGIPAAELAAAAAQLPAAFVRTESLSADPALWGRPVADERYAMLVRPSPPACHRPVSQQPLANGR